MTINVGDKLPEAKFRVMTAEGLQVKTTDDIFKGKKVALFAVPGAYTGTCHKMHLPSIFLNAYAIKDKGVNTIAIVSVNDAFVMGAWKRDTDQRDEAIFLADGNAEFTKAIGMELDASGNGLGIRSKRYSMLIDDGVVKKINLEPHPARSRSPAAIRCSGSCRGIFLPFSPCGRREERIALFQPRLQPRHRDALARQLVGALVLVVAGVALDPVPAHLMLVQRGVQPLPEVDILDRLLVGGPPAVPLPAMDPAGDALMDILAVGVEIDGARLLQGFQRRDRRHQFHAVVGGMRLAALQFFFDLAEFQDRAPAARPRIARAGAVGVNGDRRKRTHTTSPEAAMP